MNVTGIFSVSKASSYFFKHLNSIEFKALEPSLFVFVQSVKIVNDS